MRSFLYHIYGLRISSEIELPEASGTEPELGDQAKVDVVIRRGHPPREVRSFRAMAGEFEVGESQIHLRVPGLGRFFMDRGEVMTVEATPAASQHKLRVYILGMALGALLHQRGFLVLHGGACVVGEGASGFLGYSGAGKSTTTSALAARGYPILTDDLMAIHFSESSHLEVFPGLPTVKLWPDTADALFPGKGAPFAQGSFFKRRVHLPQSFADHPKRLQNLFILSWSMPETTPVTCVRVEPMQAIAEVRKQSFHPELISPMGRDHAFLDQAARLIRSCPVWRLRRPYMLAAIDGVFDLVTARAS